MALDYQPTLGEEIANAVTHGIGLLLSIAATVMMIILSAYYGNALKVVCSAIFGCTLILTYGASTLYHSIATYKQSELLTRFDYSSIYLLIAGTYTPFTLILLYGGWGWSVFGVNWFFALTGASYSLLKKRQNETIPCLVYLGMGWLIVVAIVPLLHAITWPCLLLLIGGGIAYSLGVIFFLWDNMPYNHMIWHLFVLAGSALHVCAVMFYVILPTDKLPHVF